MCDNCTLYYFFLNTGLSNCSKLFAMIRQFDKVQPDDRHKMLWHSSRHTSDMTNVKSIKLERSDWRVKMAKSQSRYTLCISAFIHILLCPASCVTQIRLYIIRLLQLKHQNSSSFSKCYLEKKYYLSKHSKANEKLQVKISAADKKG